jgi:hypothetical protein
LFQCRNPPVREEARAIPSQSSLESLFLWHERRGNYNKRQNGGKIYGPYQINLTEAIMLKRIIEWIVKRYLPGYHLHRDPVRKEFVEEELK